MHKSMGVLPYTSERRERGREKKGGKEREEKGRVGKREKSNVSDVVTQACNLTLGSLSKGAL